MNGVKKALTTKLGPLPRWAWVVLAGVGFVIYRRRQAAQAQSQQQDATNAQYGQPSNPDLSYVPGGSVPIGSGGNGGMGNGDGSFPNDGMIEPTTPSGEAPAPNPGSNPSPGRGRGTKPKPHHKARTTPKPKTKHPPKAKIRGHATSPAGREKRKAGTPVPKQLSHRMSSKLSGKVQAGPSKLRNRQTTPAVAKQHQATQRPPATHPVAHAAPHGTNPPRPSAPPKRLQRTVSKRGR